MRTLALVKHYRFADLTDACLWSISASAIPLETTVRVIDSTPDADYRFPGVDVVKSDNAIGLIESFNQWIDGFHDLYVCLNNDVVVHPRWLVGLQEAFTGQVGIAAPLYDQPGGAWLELIPPYPPDTPERAAWLDAHLRPHVTSVVPHVDNCAWAFTQALVDRIGLPDGSFGGAGWGANLDYCYRARQAGFTVVVAHGAFVSHRHRGTYGKLDPDYVANAERQRDEALRRKYGDLSVVW